MPRAQWPHSARGIELAVGDLHDVTSLPAALGGAERVFLCTPNHPLQAERETAVIAAAADAGVRRVINEVKARALVDRARDPPGPAGRVMS
jgi:uncharacterized protein YbjT (DUF2867 family)